MSAFFAAILLLGLCSANAVNFTTVYEWNKFEFVWPPGADTSDVQIERNFDPKNVYLRYMAVFGDRLFLSLDFSSGIPATLTWMPTNGASTAPPMLAPFPSLDLHRKDNCDSIQSAKGLEIDTDGRLWVLDQGSSKCSSKIWIFNLVENDTSERVHQFADTVVSHSFDDRWLRDITLRKTQDDQLAYIAEYYSEHVVVYSRKMDKSWPAKTPGKKWFSMALSPDRQASQLLYLARVDSKELYSVSVSELKNECGSADVKLIGEWTGRPYKMLIDGANVLYAAFHYQNNISKWNVSEPFREKRFHENGRLGSTWPFTFALDANGIFWMTERDQSQGRAIKTTHKLLKAAVGAKSKLFTTSTDSTSLDETSEQLEITKSSLRYESSSAPSLKTEQVQSLLGVLFINLSPQSQFLGKTQPRPQSSLSLPFLILLQTCHCVADPENGKNANLYQAYFFDRKSCGNDKTIF